MSTLELALLAGAVLVAAALLSYALSGLIGRRGARSSSSSTWRAFLPPLPVALVPLAYIVLLAAAPGLRLAAMTVVAFAWATLRTLAMRTRSLDLSARPAASRNVASLVRVAATSWLAAAPGLVVAADRAAYAWNWSDVLGACFVMATFAVATVPGALVRLATYFQLGAVARYLIPFSRSGTLPPRRGEQILAWALYALALSTPEGWLTLFAPSVMGSQRLGAPALSGKLDDASSASSPMS